MTKPHDHPPVTDQKIGILVINLGTPDAPTRSAVRRFLAEFLADKRVIETPRLIWWFILNLFILPLRSSPVAKLYRKIWDKEKDDSPLRIITEHQAQQLQTDLNNDHIIVKPAMRYGNPSIKKAMGELKQQNCHKIFAMALYPQYSATTTASSYDECFNILSKMRYQPTIRTLAPYHDDPAYINAVIQTIRPQLKTQKTDCLFLSFHGLPQSYLYKGDPYYCHVCKTVRLIREKLKDIKVEFGFQSRFGKSEWLKPYSDQKLRELAQSGHHNIIIVSPGFSSDCLETLEEINVELRDIFLEAGGKNLTFIPCLNDSKPSRILLHKLAQDNLAGWI
ncbi:MAG: ferrochelatase [Pseudomonadota bacterium]